jgi:hypothetical protein
MMLLCGWPQFAYYTPMSVAIYGLMRLGGECFSSWRAKAKRGNDASTPSEAIPRSKVADSTEAAVVANATDAAVKRHGSAGLGKMRQSKKRRGDARSQPTVKCTVVRGRGGKRFVARGGRD